MYVYIYICMYVCKRSKFKLQANSILYIGTSEKSR